MSWPRFVKKLRLALRRAPRSARDLVSSYGEYLRLQRETYRSFESEVPAWAAGQRRFLRLTLQDASRTARVLDCACGDGAGFEALGEMGFRAVVGIELSKEKALRARGRGFPVVLSDMHDLRCFRAASFDRIVCSHTLEHAYDPALVLGQFHRLLAPGGSLHVVLPYPDAGYRNELAHVGKYELGTHVDDAGRTVRAFFERRDFHVASQRCDSIREPEIWFCLQKVESGTGTKRKSDTTWETTSSR